ncbi:MAG TPA: hypothetical protein VGE74_26040 [Gemmata sp.]
MSELSAALGTAGPPHQIAHEGRTYSFHLLDAARKNLFEKRLYQRAREAVYVDREHMTPEQYVARLDAVREAYEANEYAFTGARTQKVLQTPKGAMMLIELITGETEEALTPLLMARGPEVNVLVKTVMEESFRGPKRAAPNG